MSAALPQDRKTLMQGQIGRSAPSPSAFRLRHLHSSKSFPRNRLQRKVLQLNVDVALTELSVSAGLALRLVLSKGNLDLHNDPATVVRATELYDKNLHFIVVLIL